MEGRTIARPDIVRSGRHAETVQPSMEGRTIARPDSTSSLRLTGLRSSFNGGPDNCPARRGDPTAAIQGAIALQWRAGQLPGQTSTTPTRIGCIRSLQWRAGQLPGQTPSELHAGQNPRHAFNGGPDNCPARLQLLIRVSVMVYSLQWRAGQSSGQTGTSESTRLLEADRSAFNGGPDNRPARPGCTLLVTAAVDELPSMEGRTIVRPDQRSADSDCSAFLSPSMEGRTIARPDVVDCGVTGVEATTRRSFNGGPDNRPARRER